MDTTVDAPVIELQQTITQTDRGDPSLSPRHASELKAVDGGRDAWQLLIAAFIFEAFFWGFPMAFGVFQAHYYTLPQFSNEGSKIPVIGTLAQGCTCLGAPIAAAVSQRYHAYQKTQIVVGWLACIIGLLVASFANSISVLIISQGVLYGAGFVILTYPIISMINEWWITRKGMALGLISAASGLTGIFMPLLLDALLKRYGYKITLRACAIAMIVLTTPLLPLLKGRLPPSERARQPKTNFSFLRKSLFWFYAAGYFTQGIGFFIPPIFVSTYAEAIGLSSTQAAALLAAMSAAQVLGQFVFGWLSDKRIHVSVLTSTCCVVAAIATALLWGLGKSFSLLMVYSIVYGFFAFGFITMRVALGRAVTQDQSAIFASYSIFVFLQGIGVVLVGPLTALLMSGGFRASEYAANRYKGTVALVAATSLFGGIIISTPHIWRSCSSFFT